MPDTGSANNVQVICEASVLRLLLRQEINQAFQEFQLQPQYGSSKAKLSSLVSLEPIPLQPQCGFSGPPADAESRSPRPPKASDAPVVVYDASDLDKELPRWAHDCTRQSSRIVAVSPLLNEVNSEVIRTAWETQPAPVWEKQPTHAGSEDLDGAHSRDVAQGGTNTAVVQMMNGEEDSVVKKKTLSNSRSKTKGLFGHTKDNRTKLQLLTESRAYEFFSAMLILTNAVYLGWQVQHLAETRRDQAAASVETFDLQPIGWVLGNIMYAALFTLELLLRWRAAGTRRFFESQELWWNILDIFVVITGNVEASMDIAEAATGARHFGILQSITALRTLRILRVVRIVRVIRVMVFFRELRIMVYSIIGSMKNLMWIMVVLGVTFYLFGITFASGVTFELTKPEDWKGADNQSLLDSFGTVDKGILTLFMSMSGGNDWVVYYDALGRLPIYYRGIYIFFIVFSFFALTNIVTAVFVESAMQSNLRDHDIIAHEELEAKRTYLESMQELFIDMDQDQTGTLELEEFEKRLGDERVIAYFEALKLDVSDARMVFTLLDTDSSGSVTVDEFIVGIYKLHGESRALDIKIMEFEVGQIACQLNIVEEMMREIMNVVAPGHSRTSIASKNMKRRRSFKGMVGPGPTSLKQLIDKDLHHLELDLAEELGDNFLHNLDHHNHAASHSPKMFSNSHGSFRSKGTRNGLFS
jgi:hypothetical protein